MPLFILATAQSLLTASNKVRNYFKSLTLLTLHGKKSNSSGVTSHDSLGAASRVSKPATKTDSNEIFYSVVPAVTEVNQIIRK